MGTPSCHNLDETGTRPAPHVSASESGILNVCGEAEPHRTVGAAEADSYYKCVAAYLSTAALLCNSGITLCFLCRNNVDLISQAVKHFEY